LAPTSFGLKAENKKYILEEVFLLMEYCHFSWDEAWDLPIEYRKWYIDRKKKENDRIKEARDREKKGSRPPPKNPRPPKRPGGR
jgi:hypothetical protein